ncbi:MAG: hypothetical protein IPM30_07810 [Burkholderiales bacterium]|nr:hypothetical protein [Burkholderiales bacterium]
MFQRTSGWRLGEATGRAVLRLTAASVLLVVAGCMSIPSVPDRPPTLSGHPLDSPSAPQAVAVVASPAPPQASVIAKLAESGEAAKSVAGGAALGAYVGYILLMPLALVAAGPAGILAAPSIIGGAAVVGGVVGTAAAVDSLVPKEEAAAIERLAQDFVVQLRLSEATAEAVVAGIRKFSRLDAAVTDGGAGAVPSDFRALRERGFGAAIEVKVKEVGFVGSGADPLMALFITAEARLVDTATGQAAGLRGLVYLSPQHGIRVWTQDGAELTRQEILRGTNTLAERVVDDLVLRAVGDTEPSDPDFEICGLAPRRPKPQWSGVLLFGSKQPVDSTVESVTPLLEWEEEIREQWGLPGAGELAYDLRIWSVVDGAPGALAYERVGLAQPRHLVEAPLKAGSTYFWSVRLRHVKDGRTSVSRWSASNTPIVHLGGQLRDALFYSHVVDGTVQPLPCPGGDVYPCRWLDFIPAANYHRFRTP